MRPAGDTALWIAITFLVLAGLGFVYVIALFFDSADTDQTRS